MTQPTNEKVIIETRRLVIRRFTSDDWQDLQVLAINKETTAGAKYDTTWPTDDAGCQGMALFFSQNDFFAVVQKSDQRLIGLLAFNGIVNGQLDVGHIIHTEFQDNDYDREALEAIIDYAFRNKDISSVITGNAPEWTVQIKPLESLGLRPIDGKPGMLTITRKDWEAR